MLDNHTSMRSTGAQESGTTRIVHWPTLLASLVSALVVFGLLQHMLDSDASAGPLAELLRHGLISLIVGASIGATVFVLVGSDVRALGRRMHHLGEREREFRELAESSPTLIWRTDAQGRFIYFNRAWTELTGLSAAELVDGGWARLVHDDDRTTLTTAIADAVVSLAPCRCEHRLQSRDGGWRQLLLIGNAVRRAADAPGGMVGSCIDLTDVRSGQARIAHQERTIEGFFAHAPLLMGVAAFDGTSLTLISENAPVAAMLGAANAGPAGRRIDLLLSPAATITCIARARQCIATGSLTRFEIEHRAGEDPLALAAMFFPIDSDDNGVWQLGYIMQDVTERRRHDRELVQIRMALEHAVEGFARIELSGRYVHVNGAFAAMFGSKPADLVGRDFRDSVHPDDLPMVETKVALLESVARVEFECRRIRRDGGMFFSSCVFVAIRDDNGAWAGHYCIVHDITQRTLGEQTLRESVAKQRDIIEREKMLIREVDHRVRNNLASLLGLLNLYERSGRSGREVAEAIRGKLRAMRDVHDLINRSHGRGIPLRSLVTKLADGWLPPEQASAVRIDGPDVVVAPTKTSVLAMILQELFTNCQKHGAFTSPAGSVAISWAPIPPADSDLVPSAGDTELEILWQESGGPAPVPGDQGVGVHLIRGLVGSELRGSVRFHFDPAGLRVVLRTRLDSPHDSLDLAEMIRG
jgi:PAS domain S-box-containing protein